MAIPLPWLQGTDREERREAGQCVHGTNTETNKLHERDARRDPPKGQTKTQPHCCIGMYFQLHKRCGSMLMHV